MLNKMLTRAVAAVLGDFAQQLPQLVAVEL
jgi:hypothetical protein